MVWARDLGSARGDLQASGCFLEAITTRRTDPAEEPVRAPLRGSAAGLLAPVCALAAQAGARPAVRDAIITSYPDRLRGRVPSSILDARARRALDGGRGL